MRIIRMFYFIFMAKKSQIISFLCIIGFDIHEMFCCNFRVNLNTNFGRNIGVLGNNSLEREENFIYEMRLNMRRIKTWKSLNI